MTKTGALEEISKTTKREITNKATILAIGMGFIFKTI